jgi:hypothetical protein
MRLLARLLAVFLIVLPAGCCVPLPESTSPAPAAAGEEPAPRRQTEPPGARHDAAREKAPTAPQVDVLHVPGQPKVLLGVTERAENRLTQLAVAGDTLGMAQMTLDGDAFIVEDGTQVLVIRPGILISEVRILEGDEAGRSGWVPAEWVVKAPARALRRRPPDDDTPPRPTPAEIREKERLAEKRRREEEAAEKARKAEQEASPENREATAARQLKLARRVEQDAKAERANGNSAQAERLLTRYKDRLGEIASKFGDTPSGKQAKELLEKLD